MDKINALINIQELLLLLDPYITIQHDKLQTMLLIEKLVSNYV